MSKKIAFISGESAFNSAIVSMRKSAAKMEGEIQLLLASAVLMAAMHGNANQINALATALPAGVRKAAIGDWLEKHAPVMKNDKTVEGQPYKLSRDKMAELIGEAKPTAEQAEEYATKVHALMWTEHKPDQLAPEHFDLSKAIAQLVKKVTGLQGKGTKIAGADKLEELRALCATGEDVASV